MNALVWGLAVLLIFTSEQKKEMPFPGTLLCLGDSYTIGESVAYGENFPNQTVQLLRNSNYEFEDPEIVAKTGWTTDELQRAIDEHHFKLSYNFVTLLIGVNNQYRGRPIENYRSEFENLLRHAIRFADGKADHVIVLSIPDWGVTPFAKRSGRDLLWISEQIDSFNAINNNVARNYLVNYIDITPDTRAAAHDADLLAADGLHPSGKEYAIWAGKIAAIIKSV